MSGLVDHYLPLGMDVVTGALGLPSPTELVNSIEKEGLANHTDGGDVLMAEIDSSDGVQRIARSIGTSVLDPEAQKLTREGLDGANATVDSSIKIAQDLQGQSITQNILKGIAGQNAQNAGLTNQLIGQQNRIMSLLAGLNLTSADTAKQLTQEARGEQAEADQEAAAIIQEAATINGVLGASE